MARLGELKVKIGFEISLWQAIKLRIAGKNYREMAKIYDDKKSCKENNKDD
jgi:hypothetical protein